MLKDIKNNYYTMVSYKKYEIDTKVPTFGGVIYTKYPLGIFNGTKKNNGFP